MIAIDVNVKQESSSHVPTVGSQAALKEAILFHCQGLKLNVLESRAC